MPKKNAVRIRPQRITLKTLKKLEACDYVQRLFARHYPDGLLLTPENIKKLSQTRFAARYRLWFASRALTARNRAIYQDRTGEIYRATVGTVSYDGYYALDADEHRAWEKNSDRMSRQFNREATIALAETYNAQESRRKARAKKQATASATTRLKRAA